MDMSKAIREGRDRLGMSQEALAERLGVSRQAVSKWEMGTSVPSPENRRALREHTVDQVVLFLYPTGTGVAEERQQIGVRRIRDGRTFALFRWQIPASLYSHLEVQLECGDGQTISVSQWNVIDRDSAF